MDCGSYVAVATALLHNNSLLLLLSSAASCACSRTKCVLLPKKCNSCLAVRSKGIIEMCNVNVGQRHLLSFSVGLGWVSISTVWLGVECPLDTTCCKDVRADAIRSMVRDIYRGSNCLLIHLPSITSCCCFFFTFLSTFSCLTLVFKIRQR